MILLKAIYESDQMITDRKINTSEWTYLAIDRKAEGAESTAR